MMPNKIYLVSLGCDKNRIDSEKMLGFLNNAGFSFTYDENEADVIIVNTCCFIDDAKSESIETILEMAEYKNTGKCKKLIVAGCLGERFREEIFTELPEVDAVVGVNELEKIISECSIEENEMKQEFMSDRIITTPGHFEFLKIAEGCNKCCTYCVIPKIRGRYRSFPMDDLIKEAEWLASMGVKELIIVAQETTIYGVDLYGEKKLPELLHKLCKIEGIEWIRLLYSYPEEITDELLNTIASEPKICKYLDMPIQHASDSILKKMGRRTSKADIINIINKARQIVPDITLRTSLISGFPGETDENHAELLDFVKDIKFDRLGVFTYSKEDGTPASKFDIQVPEEIKESRKNEIMLLQENISSNIINKYIGMTFDVIIDGKIADEDVYVGRTYMDTPEVDGCFFVECDYELLTGAIVKAVVDETVDYDMIGHII